MGNQWEAAHHRTPLARPAHLRGEWDLAVAQFEQAIPVLRDGHALYYVVEPLLAAADLQLDRARLRQRPISTGRVGRWPWNSVSVRQRSRERGCAEAGILLIVRSRTTYTYAP
jgi:hypothetical protein